MIKFVRVKFPNSNLLYDYICNFIDVKKGDYVYVPTKDGEKVVLVCGVFYSKLEDMPLSSDAYKKIIGRYVKPKPQSNNDKDKGTVKNGNRKKKYEYKTYNDSSYNQNSMVEKSKEGTWEKKDIIGLLIIICYISMMYWGLFTEDGQKARALYNDLNRDFPQKEYWRP